MLKPLETEFKGRKIVLECTHKRRFPPPQMYGSTRHDIDTLWKQGTIDQNQYQHLKVWDQNCGLMVMGPKCLDCPLALKQNPRPGRPNVIETENWLEAKNRMHWEDMKDGKLEPPETKEPEAEPTPATGDTGQTETGPDKNVQATPTPKKKTKKKKKRSSKKKTEKAAAPEPAPEPERQPTETSSKVEAASLAESLDDPPAQRETSEVPNKKPTESESESETAPDLDEGILDALADD